VGRWVGHWQTLGLTGLKVGGMMKEKVPAQELKKVKFPQCASQCLLVEILGVGECESACPHKFDENGVV